MAEQTVQKEQRHSVVLEDRTHLRCTGILDVDSCDEHAVCARTARGILTVEGTDLHVRHLALETGELVIEGNVGVLAYTEDTAVKSGSFLSRLLR